MKICYFKVTLQGWRGFLFIDFNLSVKRHPVHHPGVLPASEDSTCVIADSTSRGARVSSKRPLASGTVPLAGGLNEETGAHLLFSILYLMSAVLSSLWIVVLCNENLMNSSLLSGLLIRCIVARKVSVSRVFRRFASSVHLFCKYTNRYLR